MKTHGYLMAMLLGLCIMPSSLSGAEKHKTVAVKNPGAAADDGTVKGTLTLDGKAIALHHIYGRKREAWPNDAKQFSVESVDEPSCGIVDVIITNVPVSDPVLTSILQGEYHGSDSIRCVC